jgi:hypothetical protein
MFVVGDLNLVNTQLAANPQLSDLIAKWKSERPLSLQGTTPITTDDWPYLYLESHSIPVLFYLAAIVIGGALLAVSRRHKIGLIGAAWDSRMFAFFFMGAAFLLLEVHNISVSAAIFGSTWNVNAMIVAGILTVILVANGFVERLPRIPVLIPVIGIALSCLALYALPWAVFRTLSPMNRIWVVPIAVAVPMFFSGILFARMFEETSQRDAALGANLLGALCGALLQSLTFIFGTKALLLIVLGFYACAVCCWVRRPVAKGWNC